MSSNSSTEELENLRQQFLKWRQKKPRGRYPRHLWDSALKLASKYSYKVVAKQTGYSPYYLRNKEKSRSIPVPPKINFVEVKPEMPTRCSQTVRVRIQQSNGVTADLSFDGYVEQVFPLLSTVFQEADPCSR